MYKITNIVAQNICDDAVMIILEYCCHPRMRLICRTFDAYYMKNMYLRQIHTCSYNYPYTLCALQRTNFERTVVMLLDQRNHLALLQYIDVKRPSDLDFIRIRVLADKVDRDQYENESYIMTLASRKCDRVNKHERLDLLEGLHECRVEADIVDNSRYNRARKNHARLMDDANHIVNMNRPGYKMSYASIAQNYTLSPLNVAVAPVTFMNFIQFPMWSDLLFI